MSSQGEQLQGKRGGIKPRLSITVCFMCWCLCLSFCTASWIYFISIRLQMLHLCQRFCYKRHWEKLHRNWLFQGCSLHSLLLCLGVNIFGWMFEPRTFDCLALFTQVKGISFYDVTQDTLSFYDIRPCGWHEETRIKWLGFIWLFSPCFQLIEKEK